jgi:hypothetical protein
LKQGQSYVFFLISRRIYYFIEDIALKKTLKEPEWVILFAGMPARYDFEKLKEYKEWQDGDKL